MKKTPKSQRTEAALLQAARETFAEKGYFNTKISDIALAAGRSSGSFYNYYDNKEQLLQALLDQFTDEIVAAIPPHASDPLSGVRAAVTAYWETYKRHLPEMIGLFQMSMLDEEFRERWRANRSIGISGVLDGLKRAHETGFNPDVPLDLLASALVSMLEAMSWTWLAGGGDIGVAQPSDEQVIETLTTVWYRTVYSGSTG